MLLFEKEKVALQSLGDNAPETAYLSIADQFFGYDVAEEAKLFAGKAAIREAQSEEDAERIRGGISKASRFDAID